MNFHNFSRHENTLCRICLTCSLEMHTLEDKLDDKSDMSLNLATALKQVMNSKFIDDARLPKHLCHLCKSLLQISYDLKKRFDQSEKYLLDSLNISDEEGINTVDQPIILEIVETAEEKPPVEIVAGTQSFDLKDLLIVDTPDESEKNFSGFLNNLGKEISASFVKKKMKKRTGTIINEDVEVVDIKDVIHSVKSIKNNKSEIEYSTNNIENKSFDSDETNSPEHSLDDRMSDEDTTSQLPINDIDSPKLMKSKDATDQFIVDERTLYRCENCKRSFETKLRYLRHVENHCNKVHACNECSNQYSTSSKLKRHIWNNHRRTKCKFCNFIASGRNVVLRHEAKHQGRSFVCEICGKGYYMLKDLDRHRLTHFSKQVKKQELCPICGKTYSDLGYHMRAHLNIREYKCQYCDKTFIAPGQLKDHTRTHTGEKPFKCKVCQKYFSRLGMLRSHTLIHTGAKPYKCNYCEKRFNKHGNLHVHAKNHVGPFKCSICPKSFIENRYLQQHLNKKHALDSPDKQQEDYFD